MRENFHQIISHSLYHACVIICGMNIDEVSSKALLPNILLLLPCKPKQSGNCIFQKSRDNNDNDTDTDNDREFIFRHCCPCNIKDIHTMYTVKNIVMVHHKQLNICNHNLSILFQYLCITLVIQKLYAQDNRQIIV